MFTRVLAVVTLVAAFFVSTAVAQKWSAEEKQVLDNLAECWDIWMEGLKSGTPDRWISECSTPEQTYWPSVFGAPSVNEHDRIRRNWESWRENTVGWVDIRPVKLTVLDDIAVLHFYGAWMVSNPDRRTVEAKRTEVFKLIDGRWKMIAGHATPVSSPEQ